MIDVFGYVGEIPSLTQAQAFKQKQEHEKTQMAVVMVATGDDPRAAQLVALFNRQDERGKLLLLRMAACMPGAKEVG
jgi:hypothetical protein